MVGWILISAGNHVNHTPIKIWNISTTSAPSQLIPLQLPLIHCFSLLLNICSAFSRTSNEWSSTIYALLCKASLTEDNVSEIHPHHVYPYFFPFYCYMYSVVWLYPICLSVYLLLDFLVVSGVRLLWIKLLWAFYVQVSM